MGNFMQDIERMADISRELIRVKYKGYNSYLICRNSHEGITRIIVIPFYISYRTREDISICI